MTRLQIDIETYSSTDLIKCGVYRYVEAPDFEILLFGFAYDDDPVQVIDLTAFEDIPDQVLNDLTDPSVIKAAYNANFERTCISKHFGIECDPLNWRCTSVWALALGLPGNLAGVAEVLKLDAQKDAKGKALIKYFSVPCKPTKTNGERTRNYPHHDPAKWDEYKAYNLQDVVVEREVRRKLERFPVPEHEWRLWALDQRINDRGVRLDPVLIHHAIACAEQYAVRLTAEAKDLTGLENPNSLTQLKAWLAGQGLDTPDGLGKDFMPGLLDAAPDDKTRRVLELRQEMGKTSNSKYEAMSRTLCSDDRVRGILQFCGANRTWRWAGRNVQMHNLPQNHIQDLALARSVLRSGDFELLELLFGAPPFVLSQLVRTALIPSDGCRFIVSDFSAIEARVIAWLADEDWVLEVFRGHGKIYEATASRMFGVPFETIIKGHENYRFRPPGKVATLACIAEGQLVLTDKGLVPIEDVTTDHLLWDGVSWVSNDGVIDRGVKEVFEYDGLTATADHVVWVEGESRPVRFEYAAASGSRLVESGLSWCGIWLGGDYQSGETVREEELAEPYGVNPMLLLRSRAVDGLFQSDSGEVIGLSGVLSAEENTPLVGSPINSGQGPLRESERPAISQLRGKRNSVQLSLGYDGGAVGDQKFRSTRTTHGNRSEEQQRELRTRKHPMGDANHELRKQENHSPIGMASRRVALRSECCDEEALSRDDKGSDHRRSQASCSGQTEELARDRYKTRVYDIMNAGPFNRFTVSGKLVHNCGFGGGRAALEKMDKGKEISEDQYDRLVKQWREANPKIKRLWYRAEEAAMEAVQCKSTVELAHGVRYRYTSGILFADLPSGHSLAYPQIAIKPDVKFNKDGLIFYALDDRNKWTPQRTWGGTLVENLVQAIARDCLAESMVRVDTEGYRIAMHVHDEVVLDVPIGTGSLEHVNNVMGQPIPWAPGLPMRAAGFETPFYCKD